MGAKHSTCAAAGRPLTAKQQVYLYRDALRLTCDSTATTAATERVLERTLAHIEAEDIEEGQQQQVQQTPTVALLPSECAVCMADFSEGGQLPFLVGKCGHAVLCRMCMQAYCMQKINDDDCFPWLVCPEASCAARLSPQELVRLGDADAGNPDANVPLRLVTKLGHKSVVKFPEWIPCKTTTCQFGFFLDGKKGRVSGRRQRCQVCKTSQRPRLKTAEPDDTIKRMIADGSLRPCPKCGRQSMKDRGVCNVIQCMKCSTYWNWRTRETGRSYGELKAKGRKDGTLWEAGELGYQQQLESTDKEAFKKLLKANNIAYNPNYKRGSG